MKFTKFLIILILFGAGFYGYQNYAQKTDFSNAEAVFSTKIESLNPLAFNDFNNSKLSLVYEALVQIDSTLQLQPNLATSFGKLDDTTWQFTIKQGVLFHDGTELTPQLLQEYFQKIKSIKSYQSITQNFQSTEVQDNNLIIKLQKPDPLFLNKIASLPITTTLDSATLEETANGTGQYEVISYTPSRLRLKSNLNYHNKLAQFQKLTLSTMSNNQERIRYANESNNVIAVENLSPSFITQINNKKFRLQETTDLSVNFFLFNTKRANTASLANRKALRKSLPADTLEAYTENLGIPTNQFIPQGILGYNPDVSPVSQNLQEAKQAIQNAGLQGKTIKIMLPTSADKFELYLLETFDQLGMTADVDIFDYAVENLNTRARNYDLIFLGWKNDFGDGQSFFENIATTTAPYNLGNYSNQTLNSLIKQAQNNPSEEERQKKLQEAMVIIADTDPIGIPLFANKVFYGVNKQFTFQDRLDGFIDITKFQQN